MEKEGVAGEVPLEWRVTLGFGFPIIPPGHERALEKGFAIPGAWTLELNGSQTGSRPVPGTGCRFTSTGPPRTLGRGNVRVDGRALLRPDGRQFLLPHRGRTMPRSGIACFPEPWALS